VNEQIFFATTFAALFVIFEVKPGKAKRGNYRFMNTFIFFWTVSSALSFFGDKQTESELCDQPMFFF
jgi:hypothetical protein